jgi:hypothetical protein
MNIHASEKDTLYIPIGRGTTGLKIFSSKSFLGIEFERNNIESVAISQLEDERGNKYLRYDVNKGEQLTILRNVYDFPPPPEFNPDSCLNNGEWFCKWKENGIITDIVNKLPNYDVNKKILLLGERVKKLPYSLHRTKYEWADEALESNTTQDCLGLHGILCAMLRAAGIPAIVDIGFRLDGQDSPHVWLWAFDKDTNIWQMVDINDSPNVALIGDFVIKPRVSCSLGTTHVLENGVASYVQYISSAKMLSRELIHSHRTQIRII